VRRPNITDRAKRYRAQKNRPNGPRICCFCGSRENMDVDHIWGDESDDSPENLMWLCRSCNTRKGVVQARNRIGVRTRQYNPGGDRVTFAEFKKAARIVLGIEPGNVAQATATVSSATPQQRATFAQKLAEARKNNPLFGPQTGGKFKGARYGLEIDLSGHGMWVEQGLFDTKREAETEGRHIRKKEGMDYRVKATRDIRNPAAPTFAQYAHGVAIHRRGKHDEGGRIIHATPPALRHRYAQQIARIKKQRRSEVPF
jgi:hypothetical protein